MTVDGLQNSARERRDGNRPNWSKKDPGGEEARDGRGEEGEEEAANAKRRGVRRMNYRKITRQSILSSAPTTAAKEDEERGKRYRAKIYIERFSRGLPLAPLSSCRCGRRPEWRDTQRAARHRNYSGQSSLHAEPGAIFYSISSAGCDGCCAAETEDHYEKRKKKMKVSKRGDESKTFEPFRRTWESQAGFASNG